MRSRLLRVMRKANGLAIVVVEVQVVEIPEVDAR